MASSLNPLERPPLAQDRGLYHYLPGTAWASEGVRAAAGRELVHADLRGEVGLRTGLHELSERFKRAGLPLAALAGLELRSPRALSWKRFAEFNDWYLESLGLLDLLVGGRSPIARTNVVPLSDPPDEVVLVGCFFTAPAPDGSSGQVGYVMSGVAVSDVDRSSSTSELAPDSAVPSVLAELNARRDHLGVSHGDPAPIRVYSRGKSRAELVERNGSQAVSGAARVQWIPSSPPVTALDFEVDAYRALETPCVRHNPSKGTP